MIKLNAIEAGDFCIDGGAAFGVVPKKVWQKRYPCDEENFCKFTMRCLVIQTETKKILIDTGCGSKQLDYLKYYKFSQPINFETELNKIGFSSSDITDVIYTHLHFDHCGGSTEFEEDKSTIRLTFPNANHWVGKKQWENYLNANPREADSYFPENMMPIFEAGQLKLIDENTFISPEIELRLFHGHTKGQIVSYIHGNKQTFVYVGDVIPLAASIPIAWVSSYDTFPITSMEDKKIILDEAAEKGQVFIFEHDAFTQCCTIKEINGKFRVKESFKINEILF